MGIEDQIAKMQYDARAELFLSGELNRLGIPRLLDKTVAAGWLEPEETDVSFSAKPDPRIIMRVTGSDASGEKSISVVYYGIELRGCLLKVLGKETVFSGVLPEDPLNRERVFVEALENALSMPFRPPVLTGRSSRFDGMS